MERLQLRLTGRAAAAAVAALGVSCLVNWVVHRQKKVTRRLATLVDLPLTQLHQVLLVSCKLFHPSEPQNRLNDTKRIITTKISTHLLSGSRTFAEVVKTPPSPQLNPTLSFSDVTNPRFPFTPRCNQAPSGPGEIQSSLFDKLVYKSFSSLSKWEFCATFKQPSCSMCAAYLGVFLLSLDIILLNGHA